MFLDRYFTGTISVAANGTTVTGSGTAWVANGVQAGDYLHARGLMIRIAAVVSNTSITLAEGWPGATLSGAAYAILYRVDADRYGAGQAQLLNTLASGNLSSLAGLPGNTNRLPYFSAQNTMSETILTAFGRSLLEDANAAAFWATIGATSGAEQAYRRGNIVGTVSQSGGVPTGALIEYGSNANGDFWRFAGGLQICNVRAPALTAATALGQVFSSDFASLPLPANFASGNAPFIAGAVQRETGTFAMWLGAATCTTTTITWRLLAAITGAVGGATFTVTGRWH